MLRRSLAVFGGHDHGMPTTKEAAHLVQEWVMSRPVPPAPGPGKRYGSFTYPGKKTKYQFNVPEQHEVKLVALRGPLEPTEVSAQTRMSDRSIDAVVRGLEEDLNPALPAAADRLADAPTPKVKLPSRPSISGLMQYDVKECNDYLDKRGGDLSHRLKDYNPMGYQREFFPWQEKPPAPPPPKK